jgi:hypothetical protein
MNTTIETSPRLVSDPSLSSVQFETRRVETPEGRAIQLSLGYRRSIDFDERNDPGQDFAVVHAEGNYAVGVLSDGVSQSFFGEIAARCVAEGLADFLLQRPDDPPTAEAMAEHLEGLAARAKLDVDRRELPGDIPELQRAALERIRAGGSQSVFAAFVFDVGRETVNLYHVGDAGIVLHNHTSGEQGVPEPADAKGRWGTHGNSALYLRASRYTGVHGVVLRSDGARDWGDVLDSTFSRDAFEERAPDLAGFDDVSFVSAEIKGAFGQAPLAQVTTRVAAAPRPKSVPEPKLELREPTPRQPEPPQSRESLKGGDPRLKRESRSNGNRVEPQAPAKRRPITRWAAAGALLATGFALGIGSSAAWRAQSHGVPEFAEPPVSATNSLPPHPLVYPIDSETNRPVPGVTEIATRTDLAPSPHADTFQRAPTAEIRPVHVARNSNETTRTGGHGGTRHDIARPGDTARSERAPISTAAKPGNGAAIQQRADSSVQRADGESPRPNTAETQRNQLVRPTAGQPPPPTTEQRSPPPAAGQQQQPPATGPKPPPPKQDSSSPQRA